MGAEFRFVFVPRQRACRRDRTRTWLPNHRQFQKVGSLRASALGNSRIAEKSLERIEHVHCSIVFLKISKHSHTSAACLPWDLSWPLAEIWLIHAVYSQNLIAPPEATKQKPLKTTQCLRTCFTSINRP